MALWSNWFTTQKSPVNGFQASAATDANGNPVTTLNTVDYAGQLDNSLNQQNGLYGQEQNLSNTLDQEVHGGGPNLAQQQLEAATNANIRSQAGAVASLRGLNPAQQARLMQGQAAAIQQQSVGQSAEARMQMQLAAQQQQAGLQGQMGSQNLGLYGTQASANQGQNALALNNQQYQQGLNAQVAAQNTGLQSSTQAINAGLTGYGYNAEAGLANGAAGMAGLSGIGGANSIGAGSVGGAAGDAALAAGGAGDFGGMAAGAALLSQGGKVPGRANVPGNSQANDTYNARLSPGELVVPRTIANDPVAVAAFASRMAKHRKTLNKGAC